MLKKFQNKTTGLILKFENISYILVRSTSNFELREAMYVKRNNEVRSRYHFWQQKAEISIMLVRARARVCVCMCVCVCVCYLPSMQSACSIVICGMSGCNIFSRSWWLFDRAS
jgi:hypothetical protein